MPFLARSKERKTKGDVPSQGLRRLTASMVVDTRSRGWEMVWLHVQDIAWRHLVFVRPDATSPPFALSAAAPASGIQAQLAALLALDDDSSHGFVGMDAEIPRAVLRKAPFIKVAHMHSRFP